MKMIPIVARCEGGHEQFIRIDAGMGVVWANYLAQIVDGTSPFYVIPPGPDSPLAKCGICGKRFFCQVLDEEES